MKVVMLGLQATGKTSYGVGVFAAAKNKPAASVKIVKVIDPVDALNRGQELLGKRKSVDRSDTESVDRIGLEVELSDGERHVLQIPDRSGEALRGSLHGRVWQPALLAELREAEGLMVFLRPLKVQPGESVTAVAEMVKANDGEEVEEVGWSPAMVPTDAALVDALQEISGAGGGESLPIVIVISAWDEVKGMTPREWFEARVPLLAQFLACRDDSIPSSLFAVSVQGGSFEGAGSALSDDEPDPWDRAIAYADDGSEVEIAAPLVWLLRTGSG